MDGRIQIVEYLDLAWLERFLLPLFVGSSPALSQADHRGNHRGGNFFMFLLLKHIIKVKYNPICLQFMGNDSYSVRRYLKIYNF